MNSDLDLNEGTGDAYRKPHLAGERSNLNAGKLQNTAPHSHPHPHPADTTLPLHISRKRDHSDDFAELDALRGENQILRENLRILEASYKELEQMFGAKCGELIRFQQRMQFLKSSGSAASASTSISASATPVSGLGQLVRDMELSTPMLRGARDPSTGTSTSELKQMTAEQLRQHGISVVAPGSSAARRMPKRDMVLPPTNPIRTEESVDHSERQSPSESPHQSESVPREQEKESLAGEYAVGEDRPDFGGQGPLQGKPPTGASSTVPPRPQVYGQIPQQPLYTPSQSAPYSMSTPSLPPPQPQPSSGGSTATKPNYYCSLCNIVTNSETALQSHLGGDRHRKKWFRYQQSIVPAAPAVGGGAVEAEPSGPYCSPQFQGHYGYPPGAYGY